MAGKSETYCVVGVRADRSRHVMSRGLSFHDATYLKGVLLRADIFQEVAIEPDEQPPTGETPDVAEDHPGRHAG
jgi:hypothetical protein